MKFVIKELTTIKYRELIKFEVLILIQILYKLDFKLKTCIGFEPT